VSQSLGLLDRARHLGLTVEVAEGGLRVRGPRPLPADLIEELRQHRAEVLAALGFCSRCALPAEQLVPIYWTLPREELCPGCVAQLVVTFDATDTWPLAPPVFLEEIRSWMETQRP